MGVVWAGRDELLDRAVAIKEVTFPKGVDDVERATLRARTMREARTAARIWADGSVAIYDVVEEDDRPWIVMELLPSRTLQDDITSRGPLPPEEVAEIGVALLAGLSAAHAAGILHRDVKPANVMFRDGPRGRSAVLGDFGIAHFDGDATLTSTGLMIGSPAYVAPERAHGKPASVASDLWSLGVTLWTAVEGRSPFLRENALATLTAVITEDVPQAVRAGPLRPVLEGLLRKDPARRSSAADVRRMLLAVAHPQPQTRVAAAGRRPVLVPRSVPGASAPPSVPALAPPSVPPSPRRAPTRELAPHGRRRRWITPLIVAVAVPAIVGVSAALLQQDQDPSTVPTAETAADRSGVESPTTPSPSPTSVMTPPADASTPAVVEPGAGPASEGEPAPPAPDAQEAPTGVGGAAPSAGQVVVPEGFELYADPTGFSVAVPTGWQPEREGPRVYLHDPGSSAFLLVDQTDAPAPDPVADWQQQEPGVASRLDGYERIGEIRAVEFRGWQTADWEFVFGPEQRTHVLNRNVVTAPDQAYALYWSVPSSRWEELLPVHETVVTSFQPAG